MMDALPRDSGRAALASPYYADKIESLRDLFGAREVRVEAERLLVDGRTYPIVDDVIVILDPDQYPPSVRQRLELNATPGAIEYAEEIQYTFGAEWEAFPRVLQEHEREFHEYFDVVNLDGLGAARVADIGCGIGRWSYFLASRAREVVLVDFSDAIFLARANLRGHGNALFFMGDLERLPFRDRSFDLLVCIGVLMTLRREALDGVRLLARYAPRLLIYLYYALDNRPWHYRALFRPVDWVRRRLTSRVRGRRARGAITWAIALGVYYPLRYLGHALRPLGWARHVPTYEGYHDDSLERVRQDVYDRFFTSIEQRHTREQILGLRDCFERVSISPGMPYYHFLCEA